jgi:hypothetical protein
MTDQDDYDAAHSHTQLKVGSYQILTQPPADDLEGNQEFFVPTPIADVHWRLMRDEINQQFFVHVDYGTAIHPGFGDQPYSYSHTLHALLSSTDTQAFGNADVQRLLAGEPA